jgi:queuine tRNA-ribosyltransferase
VFFRRTGRDGASRARSGILETDHGRVVTPAFMPVGTRATVKAMEPGDLRDLGFQLILANAYHLFLRPGHGVIRKLGGLHRFMAWEGAVLTDSGGFQAFSLSDLRRMDESGVEFASHLDGTRFRLTPELCTEIQEALGSDIVMPLDDCPPYPAARERVEESVGRTTRWAARSLRSPLGNGQHRFGIVQGGVHLDLRARSAAEITALGFEGYAIGGVGVGEPRRLAREVVASVAPLLPEDSPRYVMGIGTPEQIVDYIGEGIDLFDCVLPTRNARNGTLFTSQGKINIKRTEYREDTRPPDPACSCGVCRRYSRAYLRHLYLSREVLASRLNTLHNLAYFASVVRRAREAIAGNDYAAFRALPEFAAAPPDGPSDASQGSLERSEEPVL